MRISKFFSAITKPIAAAIVCGGLVTSPVLAQEEESELAKANRAIANPLTNNTLFITEFDTFRLNGTLTEGNTWSNLMIIEPLIPFDIGNTGWTYILRPIVPLQFSVDTPEVLPGGGVNIPDSDSGLGDIAFLNLFTPGMNEKGYQFGAGFILQAPTATDDTLGSEKWSIGPAAIGLRNTTLRRPGDLTYGFILQNFFSFAGTDSRDDVDRTTLQYFFTWNITDNWGFLTAPTIIWDRNAEDEWSIPIGAGISYTTKLGDIPTRFVFETQYFVEQPDTLGPDWNFRLAIAMFLPKGG